MYDNDRCSIAAYHAVFLISLTLHELVRKVCELIQVQPSQVFDVYCQGPDGINVHMNDDVVQNLPDRSRYVIDAMKCGKWFIEFGMGSWGDVWF